MRKSEKAERLHRIITKTDEIFFNGVLCLLLTVSMTALIAECLLGPIRHSVWWIMIPFAMTEVIAAVAADCEKAYRAFVTTLELLLLLVVMTGLLPIRLLISGIASVPSYYRKGVECLAALQRFR